MSSFPGFERATSKRTICRARRVLEEHVEIRVLVFSRSNLLSVGNPQCQLAEWCTEVDGPGDNSEDNDRGGSNEIPERFQSLFEAIVASQVSIGKAVSWTLEYLFSLALVHSEAMNGFLKKFQD